MVAERTCACGCGEAVRSMTARFLPGHWRRVPKVAMRCRACGAIALRNPSRAKSEAQRSNARSAGRVEINWDTGEGTHVCGSCRDVELGRRAAKLRDATPEDGPPLKALFAEALETRNASLAQAEREAGIAPGGLKVWLRDPERWLTRRKLECVARWLQIPIESAIELQGGLGEDHKRAAMSKAHDAFVGKFKSPKYAREHGKKFRQKKGYQHSEQARKKIGDAKKAYHAGRSTPLALALLASTARGRARRVLARARRKHPDQAEKEALKKLRASPYGFGNELARGFFAPLSPKGRRHDYDRCTALQQRAAKERWYGYGDPPSGFYVRLADHIDRPEVDAANARDWHVYHFPRCRECLIAIDRLDRLNRKSTENHELGGVASEPKYSP
jgi:hypothetical protein